MKNKKRDDTATLTATACKCTPSYVRMVINGTRKNREDILNTYQTILKTKENLSKPVELASEISN